MESKITIQITEYEITQKQYVLYTIQCHDKNGKYEIKRRYNEFFEFRQAIAKNWPCICIPSLPDKLAFGNKD